MPNQQASPNDRGTKEFLSDFEAYLANLLFAPELAANALPGLVNQIEQNPDQYLPALLEQLKQQIKPKHLDPSEARKQILLSQQLLKFVSTHQNKGVPPCLHLIAACILLYMHSQKIAPSYHPLDRVKNHLKMLSQSVLSNASQPTAVSSAKDPGVNDPSLSTTQRLAKEALEELAKQAKPSCHSCLQYMVTMIQQACSSNSTTAKDTLLPVYTKSGTRNLLSPPRATPPSTVPYSSIPSTASTRNKLTQQSGLSATRGNRVGIYAISGVRQRLHTTQNQSSSNLPA